MRKEDWRKYTPRAVPWPVRIGAPFALTLVLLTGCVNGGSDGQGGDDAGEEDGDGQENAQNGGDGEPLASTTNVWLEGESRIDIMSLERADADFIVSGSASCVATLGQDYLHLFRDDPIWLPRARAIAPWTWICSLIPGS
jgi:hypothetical protein